MESGIIPGNAWFEKPNPAISPDWHLAFPTEPVPWPETVTGLRRASVNCFGLGGTNAHVVLVCCLFHPTNVTMTTTLLFKQ